MGLQRSPSCCLLLVAFPQQVPGIEARPVLDATVDLCVCSSKYNAPLQVDDARTCLIPAHSGRGVLQGLADSGMKIELRRKSSHLRAVLDIVNRRNKIYLLDI